MMGREDGSLKKEVENLIPIIGREEEMLIL
jgi:hypothetical protein